MKIGIDIDTIRNINPQAIKYYTENINNSFQLSTEEKEEDINVYKELKFKNKNDKNQFYHIDYPYEIYGCANPFSSNLPTNFNLWLKELENIDVTEVSTQNNFFKKIFKRKSDKKIESNIQVGLFGVMASELIIGSTLFFLSKIGCRCRDIIFPIHSEKVFERYDVIVTSNPNLIQEKLHSSIVILIKHKYNEKYKGKCNFIYDSLENMISDKSLISKLKKEIYKL
jgi:hypothetical protein